MIWKLVISIILSTLAASLSSASAQQVADPRVADLVKAGKVRVGLFVPQFIKDNVIGEPVGVWAEERPGRWQRVSAFSLPY